MLLKTFDLHTTKKTMIGGAIIASLFILLGALTAIGVLDFSFFADAWQNSGLRHIVPTKDSAIIYIIIGIFFLIASFIPSKYHSCKVYDNKLEMLNKKDEIIDEIAFNEVSDITVYQKTKGDAQRITIRFKDGSKAKEYSVNYKSEMPSYLIETYNKYKAQ